MSTVNGAGTVVTSYVNLLADTRVVGRQPSAGSRSYYHTDLLGSTRAVVQGATVTESYDYDPWGVLMPGRTLGSGTKEQFTTKERDAETGLDYFGARLYASAIGRWTSVDPAVAADSTPEWGPYGYVKGNPVVLVDLGGMCPQRIDGKPCDLNAAASFSAGFGDAVTFGITNWIRERMGTNDVVDKEGSSYLGGQVSGLAASAALGGASAASIREGRTMASSVPSRIVAEKSLATEVGRSLFGKGGFLNTGRALRIGVSKGKDGRMVFRAAGELVEKLAGTKHIDLIDLGRIADYLKNAKR